MDMRDIACPKSADSCAPILIQNPKALSEHGELKGLPPDGAIACEAILGFRGNWIFVCKNHEGRLAALSF
jgi:hypothetical protein